MKWKRNIKNINQKLKKLEGTQKSSYEHRRNFYPRVVNKTNVTFTQDELTLLNKGLKYNLSYKQNDWIKTLALEAETAITKLPVMEQDYIRFQVAHNIKLLYKQCNENKSYNTKHANIERHTLNSIKRKLSSNNAIVLKADKVNTVVITYLDDYHLKVHEFISNNHFSTVNNDFTNTFQKEIRNTDQ